MEAVFKWRGSHWWHLPVDREREGGFGAGENSANPSEWLVSSENKILGKILKVVV